MKNQTESPELGGEVRIQGVDEDGKPQSMAVLEENDIAFDPTRVTLDLTKAEKRRTTALMMAIQAYDKLIIKDAEMYMAIHRNAERGEGPKIQPATMNAMVHAAIQFDAFIAGRFEVATPPTPVADEIEQPQPEPAEVS